MSPVAVVQSALVAARYAHVRIILARHRRTPYDPSVPEKKGNRLGRLKSQKRTYRAMRFFFVRMPQHVSYERRWRGSLRACWFSFVHQSTNPAICRSPRLVAGRGLTAQKEALMPSSTCTPVQSRTESLTRLSGHANTVSALLSIIGMLPPAEQQGALMTCASILADVSRDLDAMIGGAA
jgi:hypothetical protein